MAITAKPASYSLNSGATYYPDHLWMVDEGAGTTLSDLIGIADMTLAGPAWATDGTHGDCLDFVAGTDIATYTGTVPIMGITSTFTVAVLMKAPAKTAGSVEGIAGIYTSDQPDGRFIGGSSTDGFVNWTVRDDGAASETVTRTGAEDAIDTDAWQWVVWGFGNNVQNGSVDAAYNTQTTINGNVGLAANQDQMNSFGLGALLDDVPTLYFTGQIAAVALWANTYFSEAQLTAIYNSGNVWSAIGVEAGTKKLKLLVHADAQSDASIAGVVFQAPGGSDITGAKIGEFTGAAFEGTLEGGKAVLKVPVADFGGSALTTSDTPVALVRNANDTTGMIAGTVISE